MLIPILLIAFGLTYITPLWYISVIIIFVLASGTDFLDGYLARKYNLITDLGKLLDPIADKVLVVASLFILFAGGVFWRHPAYTVLAALFCIVIVAREFLVAGLRQIAAAKNRILAADNFGKAKTASTMAAIAVLLTVNILYNYPSTQRVVFITGFSLFALGAVLTAVSGVNYYAKNKTVLAERPQDAAEQAHKEE